jgi:hypothetical protein
MSSRIAGANSGEATPVPIPNTEVKLISVDDTAPPFRRIISKEERSGKVERCQLLCCSFFFIC